MKFFGRHLFSALLMLALTGAVALGKAKKESVTFVSDVTVNGTLIKAGTYDLRFDDQSGKLEIMKDSRVLATSPVHVEKRATKARETEVHTLTGAPPIN